ncbi:hypothetical protein ACWEQC_22265 [Streptomyces shenzhenensis]
MALQTLYYESTDGSLQTVETTAENPATPQGWTLIDAETYAAKLSQWQAAQDQKNADVQAAETAQKKAAYDALIAANFDPAVAQTLSGYQPPTGG